MNSTQVQYDSKLPIDGYIRLVKDQINYFDYAVHKSYEETAQKKIHVIKYKFVNLLEYLEKQKITKRETEKLVQLDSVRMRRRTYELEEKIIEVIKKYEYGVHTKQILMEIKDKFDISISKQALNNRISNLNRNRKVIESVSRGIWRYIEHQEKKYA